MANLANGRAHSAFLWCCVCVSVSNAMHVHVCMHHLLHLLFANSILCCIQTTKLKYIRIVAVSMVPQFDQQKPCNFWSAFELLGLGFFRRFL